MSPPLASAVALPRFTGEAWVYQVLVAEASVDAEVEVILTGVAIDAPVGSELDMMTGCTEERSLKLVT